MFPGWQIFAMNLWNACLVFLPSIFWLLFLLLLILSLLYSPLFGLGHFLHFFYLIQSR
jgi:hypothetical protein